MAEDMATQLQELRGVMSELGADEVLIIGPPAVVQLKQAPEALSAAARAAAEQFLAMMEAATLIAAADHDLSEPEIIKLLALFRDLSGGQIPEDHVEEWLQRFLGGLVQEGLAARLRQNAARLTNPELRRSAFAMAVGLAYIDGEVSEPELAAFSALAEQYEIPVEEAQKLLEQVENEVFGPQP